MITMKEELKGIGARIRKIREGHRLTQSGIVENLAFGRNNYAKIEQGDVMPGLELLLMLYKTYNISLDWLFTGKGKKVRNKLNDIELSKISESSTEMALIRDIMNIPLVKFSVLEFYSRYKMEKRSLLGEIEPTAGKNRGK